MSKSTPRKSRHRNQASASGPRQIPASDYESDAAHYMESHATAQPALPTSTNTELNLRVLQRYLHGIRSILSIAANAVVYKFSEGTQSWDKHGVEGTMFVCEQEPLVAATGQALPQVCVFVLNRRGMENLAIDLVRVSDCEVVGELVVFRLEDDTGSESNDSDEGAAEKEVIGIWIHADEANTRDINSTIIRGAWQQARLALDSLIEAAAAEQAELNDGAALQTENPRNDMAAGRRLSVTDLFSQNHEPTTTASIALVDAVQTQLSLIASFDEWLNKHINAERNYGNIASTVQERVAKYKESIIQAEKTRKSTMLDQPEPWAIKTRTRACDDGSIKITVTGPGRDESAEINAVDEKQADYIKGGQYLGYMRQMCDGFAQAEKDMASLFETFEAIGTERGQLGQPAEVTVQDHISLLKEYNDMKDVGQQLIGLIAENRGVPNGTLYESGEYGVKAED
ncbi:hypothetical protein B0H63DRAFT_402852 [Podospora didyma]|uniref:Uncharacterized protein n=1 Tax=Podospora didyma TaxID=330526 RepID=A0AAE0N515_9PEZI|nr:hypothetical protein B0H63DRAFT_402852 [Podospora didyma]